LRPHGKAVVLLLTGGDKSSQQTDIRRAKELWADWKRRQR
jgi:putative addiction module killer protein